MNTKRRNGVFIVSLGVLSPRYGALQYMSVCSMSAAKGGYKEPGQRAANSSREPYNATKQERSNRVFSFTYFPGIFLL